MNDLTLLVVSVVAISILILLSRRSSRSKTSDPSRDAEASGDAPSYSHIDAGVIYGGDDSASVDTFDGGGGGYGSDSTAFDGGGGDGGGD